MAVPGSEGLKILLKGVGRRQPICCFIFASTFRKNVYAPCLPIWAKFRIFNEPSFYTKGGEGRSRNGLANHPFHAPSSFFFEEGDKWPKWMGYTYPDSLWNPTIKWQILISTSSRGMAYAQSIIAGFPDFFNLFVESEWDQLKAGKLGIVKPLCV